MSDQTNDRQAVQEEPSLSELLQIRRDKLSDLRQRGQDPFVITKFDVTHHSDEVKGCFEELEGQTVRLAGRLMSKRGMGKAVFSDLQDGAGRIQLYVRIDDVGEEALAAFKKYDIGDIVGVEGEVFRTKRGEISVKAKTITLLSKSLLPAVCGPYCEPGCEAEFYHPLPVYQVCPELYGRARLYGGGNPGAQHHLGWSHRAALYHPPQHLGH